MVLSMHQGKCSDERYHIAASLVLPLAVVDISVKVLLESIIGCSALKNYIKQTTTFLRAAVSRITNSQPLPSKCLTLKILFVSSVINCTTLLSSSEFRTFNGRNEIVICITLVRYTFLRDASTARMRIVT